MIRTRALLLGCANFVALRAHPTTCEVSVFNAVFDDGSDASACIQRDAITECQSANDALSLSVHMLPQYSPWVATYCSMEVPGAYFAVFAEHGEQKTMCIEEYGGVYRCEGLTTQIDIVTSSPSLWPCLGVSVFLNPCSAGEDDDSVARALHSVKIAIICVGTLLVAVFGLIAALHVKATCSEYDGDDVDVSLHKRSGGKSLIRRRRKEQRVGKAFASKHAVDRALEGQRLEPVSEDEEVQPWARDVSQSYGEYRVPGKIRPDGYRTGVRGTMAPQLMGGTGHAKARRRCASDTRRSRKHQSRPPSHMRRTAVMSA